MALIVQCHRRFVLFQIARNWPSWRGVGRPMCFHGTALCPLLFFLPCTLAASWSSREDTVQEGGAYSPTEDEVLLTVQPVPALGEKIVTAAWRVTGKAANQLDHPVCWSLKMFFTHYYSTFFYYSFTYIERDLKKETYFIVQFWHLVYFLSCATFTNCILQHAQK